MYCKAIGIDFGTTHACASVCKLVQDSSSSSKNEIAATVSIPTRDNCNTLACYVSFKDSQVVLGEEAKSLAIINPTQTIYDLKHFLGNEFIENYNLREGLRNYSFNTIAKKTVKPPTAPVQEVEEPRSYKTTLFEVTYDHKPQQLETEDLVGMIIKDLKQSAEQFCNLQQEQANTIAKAVVSVPVYFNETQSQAMVRAAERAGIEVLATIAEPIAAAKAYGLDKWHPSNNSSATKNILVFDIGGARLDITLLRATANEGLSIVASQSLEKIGGDDFLHRLVNHVRETFGAMHGLELAASKLALRRTLHACEHIKRALSSETKATIQLDCLIEDIDFTMTVSRDEFENMCMDLFMRMLEPVYNVLRTANVGKDQIDDVILAGGSAKIPRVQQLLSQILPQCKFNLSLPADEIIAQGAAIYAHELSK